MVRELSDGFWEFSGLDPEVQTTGRPDLRTWIRCYFCIWDCLRNLFYTWTVNTREGRGCVFKVHVVLL
jgi:hypothetical protein